MTEEIRKQIEEVDATMRLEGMPLPLESKEMLRRCLKVSQHLKQREKEYLKK